MLPVLSEISTHLLVFFRKQSVNKHQTIYAYIYLLFDTFKTLYGNNQKDVRKHVNKTLIKTVIQFISKKTPLTQHLGNSFCMVILMAFWNIGEVQWGEVWS